ncbi:hypothetical protein [Streptomyces sp. DW26H14]|uniref:hypothetical protein n=1 Tax=Streptomyces sp. DW26H14 TaxID=3435395 RepID=UPI00403D93A7
MSTVTMRHPSLPPEQTITVLAIAAPHHRAAGWVPVDDAPAAQAEPDPAPELPAPEGPLALEASDTPDPVAPKRRRTQKEDI